MEEEREQWKEINSLQDTRSSVSTSVDVSMNITVLKIKTFFDSSTFSTNQKYVNFYINIFIKLENQMNK